MSRLKVKGMLDPRRGDPRDWFEDDRDYLDVHRPPSPTTVPKPLAAYAAEAERPPGCFNWDQPLNLDLCLDPKNGRMLHPSDRPPQEVVRPERTLAVYEDREGMEWRDVMMSDGHRVWLRGQEEEGSLVDPPEGSIAWYATPDHDGLREICMSAAKWVLPWDAAPCG